MSESFDRRRRLPDDVRPNVRGPKRVGPIGTITPGDHVEVARDIQRLRMQLDALERRVAGRIRFNFNNKGDWFYLEVAEQLDLVAADLLRTNSGSLTLQTLSGNASVVSAGAIILNSNDGVEINPTDHVRILLGSGEVVSVLDPSNNSIFEVRSDGTIHIKTGDTIVADL
jgi:hypothetical protein